MEFNSERIKPFSERTIHSLKLGLYHVEVIGVTFEVNGYHLLCFVALPSDLIIFFLVKIFLYLMATILLILLEILSMRASWLSWFVEYNAHPDVFVSSA